MMVRVGVSRGQRTSPGVPESAVSVQGDGAFAYVVRERPAQGQRPAGAMVEQRPIVTGARQQGYVEIREGLRPGERVVADGLNKLQPGQPVRVARSPGMSPKPTDPGLGPQAPAASPPGSQGARPAAARPAA
jgi:membrane fusion protein (multidrug efflux system)